MLNRTRDRPPTLSNWTLKFNRVKSQYTLIELFDHQKISKKKFVIDIFIVAFALFSMNLSIESVNNYLE